MMGVGRRHLGAAAREPAPSLGGGPQPEMARTGHSAKMVLEAAAARTRQGQRGAEEMAGATDDLEAVSAWLGAHGVLHGWQLAHLERADWEEAGATLGLRSAVRAVLLDSSESEPEPQLTPFQQRFLLQPDPRTASSLGSLDAAFLGTMMVVPAHEKQQLYLAAGELLGVLSGLMLAIPLTFLKMPGEGQDASAELTAEDGINTLAITSFFFLFVSLLSALLGVRAYYHSQPP